MLTKAEDSTFNIVHSVLDAERRYELSKYHNLLLLLRFRLMVVNLLTQAVVFGFIWWIGSIVLGTTMKRSSWIAVFSYLLFSYL